MEASYPTQLRRRQAYSIKYVQFSTELWTPNVMETWRDRLKQALREKERSMRDVSMKAGLSEGYLAGILQDGDGQRDPSIEAVIAIANEVGVTLSWLMDDVNLTVSEARVLRLLKALGPRQQEALLQAAEAMLPPASARHPESAT